MGICCISVHGVAMCVIIIAAIIKRIVPETSAVVGIFRINIDRS